MWELPEPLRDELGRTVWLAVWGDLRDRKAVYVKARTYAGAMDLLALERPQFGSPRWVRRAGDASARMVLFAVMVASFS
jgi:hypothetical protein